MGPRNREEYVMKRLKLLFLFLIIASLFVVAYVLPEGTQELIGLIVALILGFLGMKPINWLKEKLGLEDTYALLLVYGVSGVIGAIALWATGELTGLTWSLNNLVAIAGMFFAAAKFAYETMKMRA
jgi:ammonia channel protein AmtB